MRLSGLNVFPVKSLAALSLPEARVEPFGLAFDRRWMLVDGDGKFLSQRVAFPLSRVTVKVTPSLEPGATVVIEAPGRPPLRLPLVPAPELPVTARGKVDASALRRRLSDLSDE